MVVDGFKLLSDRMLTCRIVLKYKQEKQSGNY
jgi:hypothetical protein